MQMYTFYHYLSRVTARFPRGLRSTGSIQVFAWSPCSHRSYLGKLLNRGEHSMIITANYDMRQRISLFCIKSRGRPASYSVDTGDLPWGMKLTAHLHLVPRLRMSGAVHLLPLMPSWRV